MYYRNQKTPYKKYLLYAAVILSAAGLIFFGSNTLKTELEEARAAAASPEQKLTSNYSPIENSSQEDTELHGSASENAADKSASSKAPAAENSQSREASSQSASADRDASSASGKSADADEYYTITVYEGNIAVFKNDEKRPINILDIPVEYFPLEDQKLLKAGIRVKSLGEAMQLLEDYR